MFFNDLNVKPPARPKFCPYCGAQALKFNGMVPRCRSCRAVFHLQFSRTARKSPAGARQA